MAREKTPPADDGDPGAPEWMVTFSDCMTLLLTFFVLLLSFSSFDVRSFKQVTTSFITSLTSIGRAGQRDMDAFAPPTQFKYNQDLSKGSETPTLIPGMNDNLKQETDPVDFQNLKVFMVGSPHIFWGNGTLLSAEGKQTLSLMASYLQEAPHRVVISENPGNQGPGDTFGLQRAWTVLSYLTEAARLDPRQFSVSMASLGTVPNTADPTSVRPGQRRVEIVLLERSIYK